jgi:hypothetical protein
VSLADATRRLEAAQRRFQAMPTYENECALERAEQNFETVGLRS